MIEFLLLPLFFVPVGALVWRVIITKSRSVLLRIGGAAAVMATTVGALVVDQRLTTFRFSDWRGDVALAAASAASIYLLLWALRHRTNRRHRTLSVLAAMIGVVPIIGALAVALLEGGL